MTCACVCYDKKAYGHVKYVSSEQTEQAPNPPLCIALMDARRLVTRMSAGECEAEEKVYFRARDD